MMVKTKPNQKIHVDKLQTTLEKLGQLKEKPKSELNLRESIYYLRDKLKSALKKGYSYQDLSEILAEQDILISAATLKQYLAEINKQSAARKKRIKSKQSQKSKSSSIDSNGSSSNQSKTTTDYKTKSKQDLSKDVNSSKENSEQYLSTVESDNVVEVSKSDTQKESVSSQSKSRTSTKAKTKKLSGSDRDLSSEFNQY